MHKLNGKRVLIIQQRGWARVIGIPLGRELSRLGCKLGAVTIKKSTHEAILKSGTNYEFIFLSDRVKEDPSAFVDQQATSLTLDGVCKALGIETMWELAQASRYM